MQRCLLLLCVLVTRLLPLCAQDDPKTRDSLLQTFLVDNCYCETSKPCAGKADFYTNSQIISTYSMNRLIRLDLTKITLDEEGLPSLGNYATAQFSGDLSKVTFNASVYNPFTRKKAYNPIRGILSINVQAVTSDNVATLFSSENAGSGVNIKLKWSILGKQTKYENDDQLFCNTLKLARDRLKFEYDNVHALYLVDSMLHRDKNAVFNRRGDSIRNRLSALYDLYKTAPVGPVKDSSQRLLTATNAELLKFFAEYNTHQQNKPFYDSTKIIDSFYKRMLDFETKSAKWTKFNLTWTDIDVGLGGERYVIFDQKQPIDKQLGTKKFNRWSMGVTRNIFRSRHTDFFRHGYFLKLGYKLGSENSLTGETPKEINTKISVDTPGFHREVVEKKNGYDVPYATTVGQILMFRLSNYLNENRNQAISFLATASFSAPAFKNFYKIQDGCVFTPGLAYLYAFQDKGKEKNVVNIELFLNFQDVFNSRDKATKFYQRHELGIKFAIPFNSIFLNN